MKIAIDTYPLHSMHKTRGIGVYTDSIVYALKKYDTNNKYIAFNSQQEKLPLCDLVFYPYFELFARTVKVYKDISTVITVHDLIPIKYKNSVPIGMKNSIYWNINKRTLKKAHAIITDSNASKLDIISICNINSKLIHVIYPSVLPEFFEYTVTPNDLDSLTKEYNLTKPIILYVGDVNWNKNILFIIKVFSRLRISNPDLTLVLVGDSFNNTTLKEALEINNLVDTLRIQEAIIKTGFVSVTKLKTLYSLSKVYVQPSIDEGFGLSVLEALTVGTLVASSNHGSLPEVGGKASFYFNPRNEDEAVRTISALLNINKEKRGMYIKAGKNHAEQFSWERSVNQLSNLFKSL